MHFNMYSAILLETYKQEWNNIYTEESTNIYSVSTAVKSLNENWKAEAAKIAYKPKKFEPIDKCSEFSNHVFWWEIQFSYIWLFKALLI